ncbi:FkbM family methyltransferase [Cylindrospermopsis raciborskii]|uniref:FkbM family methyltransferase n=1 Tax=Cylindrospermopsis raciborskii TaxID=77022 RepID=UPI00387A5E3F
MLKNLKKTTKSLVNAMGLDVYRLTPSINAPLQTCKSLSKFKIDLVFDIGANTGQFASSLRSMGYRGHIISFEPLYDAHKELTSQAARDPKWRVHPRIAIGDSEGEIEINVAGNSVSSSVLPMLETHKKAALGSAYINKEKVRISRLDSIAPNYISGKENILLKIDTQGFEWQVLDGAEETLSKCQGVLCELSLVPLYEGQRLWLEVIERLNSMGFTLWTIQSGFIDSQNGRTLQVDAMFFRLS